MEQTLGGDDPVVKKKNVGEIAMLNMPLGLSGTRANCLLYREGFYFNNKNKFKDTHLVVCIFSAHFTLN